MLSLCNESNPSTKFDSRNFKCIFLGFTSYHKGYLLYDIENVKLLTSRDVHFVPETFPYLDNSSPVVHDLVLPLVSPNFKSTDGETIVDHGSSHGSETVLEQSMPQLVMIYHL